MSEQAQPCPFCGTPDPDFVMGHKYAFFECRTCGSKGPDVFVETGSAQENRDLATEVWNKREANQRLETLLTMERDDYATLQGRIVNMLYLLEIAVCMMDKKPAALLSKQAQMLGIKLEK